MKNIGIIVRGNVQGVFFRKYTVEKAKALNLKGYVTNQRDGSVKIVVQGDEDALNAFKQWCWQGSPQSKAERVEVTDVAVNEVFNGFEIRR